ncbi:hypothetical protein INT45_008672 [Circinella minor]|uniref:Protein SCAI n=1 Tax=Circinella minor TaxID=1195481 RepID=A0A8H7RYL8_9FUNG|nr:hypothetical protein INT45_008672 [Circinella minor]
MEQNEPNSGQSVPPTHKVNDISNQKATTVTSKDHGGATSEGNANVPVNMSTASTQQGGDARSTIADASQLHNNSNSTGQTTTTSAATTTNSSEQQQQPQQTPGVPQTVTAADESALQNQKLVEEFQYLLEKSQSLFSGLRDLPPTGSHRQWRPLWKFQQTHRPILEDKNNYGLKRWEVGEIASKIGQLYYHYYLRTSDTSYLQEAFVFYDAIHERQYFKDILEVKNPALMIKKMRYYARFVVVSLLLNKDSNIRLLISELESLVDEYTKSFKPPDAKEWQIVLDEINTFMEAEKKLAPVSADRIPVTVEHRLSWSTGFSRAETQHSNNTRLKLQEAILVGNCQKQIKFSELTLDMYRILQSLEMQPAGATTAPTVTAATNPTSTTTVGSHQQQKGTASTTKASSVKEQTTVQDGKDPVMSKEKSTATARSIAGGNDGATAGGVGTNILSTPSNDVQQQQSQEQLQAAQEQSQQQQQQQMTASNIASTAPSGGGDKGIVARRINPHKYLLYRPSLSQLFVYISTAFKDTADNGVMFLYLSADGCEYPDAPDSGYKSGVATNSRKTQQQQQQQQQQNINATSGSATTERSDTTPASSGGGNSGGAGNSGATGVSTSTSTNPATSNINPGGPSSTTIQAVPIVSSVHCLHPADLIPFTRKPLFLIVDSSSSVGFSTIPNIFDQPVMSLMSPVEYPSSVQDRSEIGSLFTLFLHTPLLGFCSVSDIGNLEQEIWDNCVSLISSMEQKIGETLLTHPDVDSHVKRFMTDEFLWTFIVRFTLCCIILRCHSSFKDEKTFPSCYPPLPDDIYSAPDIIAMLRNLTEVAEVATYFSLPFLNEEAVES